ncbi:MAG: hypothetical protein F6K36_13770 [Symploca sp. SIO3C6]|nr:hypothetical protein [Symploca sp. SIO3C6]NET07179.1 hypothetical protein [Symploca sp. SIO2B6]NET50849.1 hypothetical protein [Merismopedia sp. SIO2A8]
MKTSSVYSPFTALTLKLVGLVMIVSSLLDYIILAIPSNSFESADAFRNWQWAVTTQSVDRGVVPLVGIALFLVGYWIRNSFNDRGTEPTSYTGEIRFWVLVLSTILGLLFLLLVLLHTSNTLWRSNKAFEQIEQQATQVETQLRTTTEQLKTPEGIERAQQRLAQLERAIESGQVPQAQLPQAQAQLQAIKAQLQALKENPEAVNQKFDENLNQILSRKLEAENRVKANVWKSGIKTIVSSLLLAIGYTFIGWTGLRSLGI